MSQTSQQTSQTSQMSSQTSQMSSQTSQMSQIPNLLEDSPPPAPSLLPPGTNWQLWAEERNRSWWLGDYYNKGSVLSGSK